MWEVFFTLPVGQSVNLDNRFVRAAPEGIFLQVENRQVPVDAIVNTRSLDFGFDDASVKAAHHVAKFPCALFDEIEFNDFTLGQPPLEFANHSEFSTEEERVDIAVGFGNHVGGTLHIGGVHGDDVGGDGGDGGGSHIKIY